MRMWLKDIQFSQRISWGSFAIGVLLLRAHWLPRDYDTMGSVAYRDLGLTLALWLLFILLSSMLGKNILNRLVPINLEPIERWIIGSGLGLGIFAYSFLGLGTLGILTPTYISLLLVLTAVAFAPDLTKAMAQLHGIRTRIRSIWMSKRVLERAIISFAVLIGFLSFLNSLGPPWDYDGLMYHLVGPRLFLAEGRLIPDLDNWYINSPFTIEMTFLPGMAFGDDIFPKLLHFTFGVLFVGTAFILAKKCLNSKLAWLTVAVLLTVPTIPVWSSFAYIDMGWSAFEVLAFYGFLAWWKNRNPRWLLISGIFSGFSMGSKYLGLIGFGLIGLFILVQNQHSNFRARMRDELIFVLPAILVASPWYLKNLIWFRNPVYPFIFGGPGWDVSRLELYMTYLSSFGTGRTFQDFILLPLNLYFQHERFGAVMNRIDIPSILFPIVLIYPFRSKKKSITILLLFVFARFFIWAIGSQQTRFLMPIFPLLSIGAVHVMDNFSQAFKPDNVMKDFLPLLSVGLMAITLFYQFRIAIQFRPLIPATGMEARNEYLSEIVKDYPATQWINTNLNEDEQVVFLGDGREYYCNALCKPDPDHFRWAGEITTKANDQDLLTWMATENFTHILFSIEDLDFLLQHDLKGVMDQTIRRINRLVENGCLTQEFRDDWSVIYRISCKP
jgi:4-amino-4-deoxy-L-arabinose transferase-like glycosyltransferase